MRKTFVFLPLLWFVPIAAMSQMMSCELTEPSAPGQRSTIYELQKPFPHPVALPGHVLALLRANAEILASFNSCPSHKSLADIPPEWFQATEVKLADTELPGLVVKAVNKCLWEKESSMELVRFWVFRQSQTGYQLVLAEKTQALQILGTRTAGYRDLCTISSPVVGHFTETGYSFREGKYLPDWNGGKVY